MKITSHRVATPELTKRSQQEEKADIQESKKTPQDSLLIAKNSQMLQIKEINQAIGALQSTDKALQQLTTDAQNLISSQKDSAIEDTTPLRTSINDTLAQSSFNGKKLFNEDYKPLSANIKVDFTQLKKQAKNLENTSEVKRFLQEVKLQQSQTKQAITILQNQINNTLQTSSKDFENLNTAMLQNPAFQSAHNTETLSLDRVSKLLA